MVQFNLDRLRNENGGFSEPDTKVVEKMTGKPFAEVVQEFQESKDSFLLNGKPVTSKSQLKDVNKRAQFFEHYRQQGKNPREVYNSLD